MFSQWGIIDAKVFKVNAALVRLRNQLVKLDTDGKITPAVSGGLFFPVKRDVGPLTADEHVDYQISGVASVYVESATNIVAGSVVIVGPTGVGVVFGGASEAAIADDATIVGIAMLPAAGLNEIPVLLTPKVFVAPE